MNDILIANNNNILIAIFINKYSSIYVIDFVLGLRINFTIPYTKQILPNINPIVKYILFNL